MFKDEPLIKEEPVDLLPPAGLLSGVSVSCQTSPRTSPPPFTTEWEEGVRRSVWQPGYLPQPEPPGTTRPFVKEYTFYPNMKGGSGRREPSDFSIALVMSLAIAGGILFFKAVYYYFFL